MRLAKPDPVEPVLPFSPLICLPRWRPTSPTLRLPDCYHISFAISATPCSVQGSFCPSTLSRSFATRLVDAMKLPLVLGIFTMSIRSWCCFLYLTGWQADKLTSTTPFSLYDSLGIKAIIASHSASPRRTLRSHQVLIRQGEFGIEAENGIWKINFHKKLWRDNFIMFVRWDAQRQPHWPRDIRQLLRCYPRTGWNRTRHQFKTLLDAYFEPYWNYRLKTASSICHSQMRNE